MYNPTDTKLTEQEFYDLETLIDRRGIEDVLMALHELCEAKSEHITANWGDKGLAKQWATVAGAVGVAVPKAFGL